MANKKLIIHNPHLNIKEKALGLIMCTAQETNADMIRALKPLGVSPLQVQILHILSEAPKEGLTVNQIKPFLIEESPNLSRALNKLMYADMIVKKRSKEDQRVVHIRITEAGREMHKKGDEAMMPFLNLNLSDEDAQKLYEILEKL